MKEMKVFSNQNPLLWLGQKHGMGLEELNEPNVVSLPSHSPTSILPAKTHFTTCVCMPKSNVALQTFV
jgi:hypothetical protein